MLFRSDIIQGTLLQIMDTSKYHHLYDCLLGIFPTIRPTAEPRVEATLLPLPATALHPYPPVQASVNSYRGLWDVVCALLRVKTHCRSWPVLTTATPMGVVFLDKGVVGKSPHSTNLVGVLGESLDPDSGSDDDGVRDVVTLFGALSWIAKSVLAV